MSIATDIVCVSNPYNRAEGWDVFQVDGLDWSARRRSPWAPDGIKRELVARVPRERSLEGQAAVAASTAAATRPACDVEFCAARGSRVRVV
eukprot:6630636-Prymnesium_polylepis.1